jgi:hypothetical protein
MRPMRVILDMDGSSVGGNVGYVRVEINSLNLWQALSDFLA